MLFAGRPVVRTNAVSVAGVTFGVLVAVAVLAVHVANVWAQETRATARATASVSSVRVDRRGNETAADLRWTDADGTAHLTRVQVTDEFDPTLDSPLVVRYDPGDPRGLVFPAEGEEFPPPGDWQRYALLAVLAVYPAMLLALGARLLLNLRATRAPAATWLSEPLLLTYSWKGSRSFAGYLRLIEEPTGDEPGRRYLQRVYWDPALDRIRRGEPVTVQVAGGPLRRAVVTLDDGTRLWPAGRLRRRKPFGWLEQRRPVGAQHRRLPTREHLAVVAAAALLPMFGPDAAIAFAGVSFALVYFAWGLYGGEAVCSDGAEDRRPTYRPPSPDNPAHRPRKKKVAGQRQPSRRRR